MTAPKRTHKVDNVISSPPTKTDAFSVWKSLMKEAPGSSETSVITRATRRNNPEYTILHMKLLHKRSKDAVARDKLYPNITEDLTP
jgi:hypothetical protein